jgi:alpha-tubulin suppressor-like RCC1 family protein
MPYEPTTNFKDSNNVDLGRKLVTKDYLLSVYETILESSGASGLVVTPELWDINSAPSPSVFTGSNWKQVSAGKNHKMAIKTDGSLWGTIFSNTTSDRQGQLGTNDTENKATPVTTFAGGTTWTQVSCGSQYTAAIKTDGSLWTWGLNSYGQLGTNDTNTRTTPVTTFVGGNTWKSVNCGKDHIAAIKTDGSLWLWGRGTNSDSRMGGLGLNTDSTNKSTPVTTFAGGTNWKSVACAEGFTAAIKTDGTLWTWGYNHTNGFLGINLLFGNSTRSTPVTTFAGGNNWKQVSCGPGHTAAVKTDGTLWTWGQSAYGKLGINATPDFGPLTPVTTFAGGNNWKQVSCGTNHTAAIKTDGSLWTWGRNSFGASLGTNDSTDRSTPVTTFAGGNNWKQVSGSVGGFQTIAIQTIDYI